MFRRAGLLLAVGIGVLSVTIALVGTGNTVHATEPATWVSGVPNLQKIGDATAKDAQTTFESGCQNVTIPVVRVQYQKWLKNNETHCMVSTPDGLIDDKYTVYMPDSSPWAFPLTSSVNSRTSLVPVPGQFSAVALDRSPIYLGHYLGYYNYFPGHMVFRVDLLNPYYELEQPDSYFKRPDGSLMVYLPRMAFSNNGDFVVGEARAYGFTRIDLRTQDITTFLANTPDNSAGDPMGAEVGISPSGRYAAVAFNYIGSPKAYFRVVDVDSCSTHNAPFDIKHDTCKQFNYLPLLQQKIPGLTQIYNIQFASDNAMSFVAKVGVGPTATYFRYEMSPLGQPTRLADYLALGDSFASGEGTFFYQTETDKSPNRCHLSIASYPYLLDKYVGVTHSVACSGAVIHNITGDPEHTNQLGKVKDSDIPQYQKDHAELYRIPGVIAQTNFVNDDNPQVISISVGGNDAGFSDIIKRCIIPFNKFTSTAQNCYQTYEDRLELVNLINAQYGKLVDMYKILKRDDPTRRVYVIGYPQVIGSEGRCGVNVRMSQSDREFAVLLTDYLDSVIERASAEAGVFYVDTQHAFDGHKLCESGRKAVNGLTAGNDHLYGIGNESYHPNRLGHDLLADTIAYKTRDLTAAMPRSHVIPEADKDTLPLLKAPHTGRLVYNLINSGQDILFVAAGTTNLVEDGFNTILRAGSNFVAELHSTSVHVGDLVVDADGILHGDINIPASVPAGFHTLNLYGQDKFGQAIDIQRMVYVAASASDYDGDGVLNADDSCPALPQSGVDEDQDGIDDACDAEMNPAQTSAGYNSNDQVPTTDAPSTTSAAKTVTTTYLPQAAATLSGSNTSLQIGSAKTAKVLGVSETSKPQAKQSPTNKVEAKNAAHGHRLAVTIAALFALIIAIWACFVRGRRSA